MNRPIAAAATLMAATCFVHVVFGGPEVDLPIRMSDVPEMARATAHVVWHMASWMLAVISAALFWLSRHENRALETTLAALQLGTAALFLWINVTWFGALFALPQWTIFVAVAALSFWGRRRGRQPSSRRAIT